jgi:hypothetical protein
MPEFAYLSDPFLLLHKVWGVGEIEGANDLLSWVQMIIITAKVGHGT